MCCSIRTERIVIYTNYVEEVFFQIWMKKTLEEYGFHPENASYYMVFHFDHTQEISFTNNPKLQQGFDTYRSKIRPLSDFFGME